VLIPAELLEKRKHSSKSLTETIGRVELVAAGGYDELRSLKGKVPFSVDWRKPPAIGISPSHQLWIRSWAVLARYVMLVEHALADRKSRWLPSPDGAAERFELRRR